MRNSELQIRYEQQNELDICLPSLQRPAVDLRPAVAKVAKTFDIVPMSVPRPKLSASFPTVSELLRLVSQKVAIIAARDEHSTEQRWSFPSHSQLPPDKARRAQ
jgi:hypothetical protein